MRLIFIYGMPASGKLTVAHELHLVTGFPVFHNHLVVDLLLSTFEFGSQPFVELREQIWLSVFDQAARAGKPGLIFTFAPETTVRDSFIPEATRLIESANGAVDFVQLACSIPELRRRLDSASRHHFGKLTSPDLFDQLLAGGTFDKPAMPEPTVTIDTTENNPARAALEIARALNLV